MRDRTKVEALLPAKEETEGKKAISRWVVKLSRKGPKRARKGAPGAKELLRWGANEKRRDFIPIKGWSVTNRRGRNKIGD